MAFVINILITALHMLGTCAGPQKPIFRYFYSDLTLIQVV